MCGLTFSLLVGVDSSLWASIKIMWQKSNCCISYTYIKFGVGWGGCCWLCSCESLRGKLSSAHVSNYEYWADCKLAYEAAVCSFKSESSIVSLRRKWTAATILLLLNPGGCSQLLTLWIYRKPSWLLSHPFLLINWAFCDIRKQNDRVMETKGQWQRTRADHTFFFFFGILVLTLFSLLNSAVSGFE